MDAVKQIVKCSSNNLHYVEWEDGSTYKGNFILDIKVGYGEFTWANGEKYTGEFYKDQHHGKGIYTWPDGSKFTGSFYLNRKEGYGTMEINDRMYFQANCHYNIINLLLDNGANVNKLNDEGLSALSISLLRYYPSKSFQSNIAEKNITKVTNGEDSALTDKQIEMEAIPQDNIIKTEEQLIQDTDLRSDLALSPKNFKINVNLSLLSPAVPESSAEIKLTPKSEYDIDYVSLGEKSRICFRTNSDHSIFDFDAKMCAVGLQKSADLFSDIPKTEQQSDASTDEETVKNMAQLKEEQRQKWSTIKLLLRRGADPNISSIPMHPLFFAVKTGDVEAVRLLLEKGAASSLHYSSKLEGLSPLHIAVALPGEEGVKITEMLLHSAMNPNERAVDDESTYPLEEEDIPNVVPGFSLKGCNASGEVLYNYFEKSEISPEEGGRTPLHIACQRTDNYQHARDIVRLLLMHKANPNLLWLGHSPLSLAIASGNDLVIKELLGNGADPNLPLGKGIESALCSAVSTAYEQNKNLHSNIFLIDTLINAGAMHSCQLLLGQEPQNSGGNCYRLCILQTLSEADQIKDAEVKGKETPVDIPAERRHSTFKYCYGCGRSVGVQLSPCPQCKGVYTCSSVCKKKAWNEYHKNECATLKDVLHSSSKIISAKQGSKRQTDESSKESHRTKQMRKGMMVNDETEKSSAESRKKMMQKRILTDDETDESSTGSRSAQMTQRGIKGKVSGDEGDKISGQKMLPKGSILKGSMMSKEDDEGKKVLPKGAMAKGETEGTSKESYGKNAALKGISTKGDGVSQENLSKKTPKGISTKGDGVSQENLSKKTPKGISTKGDGVSQENLSKKTPKGISTKGDGVSQENLSKKTPKGISTKGDGVSQDNRSNKTPKGIIGKGEDEEDSKESRSRKMRSKKDEVQGSSRESQSTRVASKGFMSKTEDEEGIKDGRSKKMTTKGLVTKGETEGSSIGPYGKKMTPKGMFAKEETEGNVKESQMKKIIAKGILSKGETERFHVESQSGKRTSQGIRGRAVSAESSMGIYSKQRMMKGLMSQGVMDDQSKMMEKTEYYTIDNYSFI
ncbi:ankyrin repeat and MYND domain-containing protein 1 [Microcaecilia unicolor]|uniref:Ankyrin repeat and MYND domain-containing protein 1 n=1 Tax=Microcaecilia unicolor TaxID=1415580 RepID=A0A6P7ZB67_9AMPH|nr:ankyrin repeat and MYND domain-containing protein 1 [Microcaecilia unicolor]